MAQGIMRLKASARAFTAVSTEGDLVSWGDPGAGADQSLHGKLWGWRGEGDAFNGVSSWWVTSPKLAVQDVKLAVFFVNSTWTPKLAVHSSF